MKTFIIAEAGDNHNGKIDLAFKLVDAAVDANADCVKFQTFITEDVISKSAEMADYQKSNIGFNETQFEMVKKLELSFDEFKSLNQYCKSKNIMFLSTAFDLKSIDFLQSIDIPFWKIPSGEITNLPYLIKIAKTNKDVILSTGMTTIEEISDAVKVLKDNGAGKISILQCNTEYPTPMEDVNLRAMESLKNKFNVDIGLSDHSLGIEVPIAAVALGATIIEKHFTLSRSMKGPDHKASLEPNELKQMVLSIRNIETALGNGIKAPSKSEIKNLSAARKSIVASKFIKKGDVFSEENITTKRPGNGISPMKWFSVIGKQACKDFNEDEMIEL